MGEYLKGRRRRVSNLSIRRALFVVGVFLLCLVVFTAIAAAVFVAGNMRTGKAELVGKDLPPDPLHILLIGVAEKPEGAAFAVVGFDFAAEKIEVTALPFESLCKADGREDTLGGHLRYGSTISAVEAAGEFLNIKIDRYAKVNLGKFETVIDKLDGLVYYIAGNLFYRDESGKVIVSIEPGNQRLTGAKTGELLRYDRWPGGRAEQIRTQENVFVELINHKLTADTLKTGETLFKVCVSLIDTDVSLADYMRYSEWLSNLAAKENPAVAVSAGGSFSARDGQSVYKRRL